MTDVLFAVLYAVPLVLILYFYLRRHRRHEAVHQAAWQESVESGLTESASLHPVIDPKRCLGSRGCVTACPEKAIGIIGGKAQLVNPAHCIGQ